MRRKGKWLGAGIAVLALCATAAWLLWPAGTPITEETYRKLTPGMTRGEAEGLLGGRGGTRQDFVVWLDNRSPVGGPGEDLLNGRRAEPGVAYWYADTGVIILRFDAEDRVAGTQFLRVRESTVRQALRRLPARLGW